MNRSHLIEQLENYQSFDLQEEDMRARMEKFVKQYENCFERSLLIGHVTGSAWVVNQKRTKVLLIHHAKLQKWLQPGGHCDGNANVYEVALTELLEETGLSPIDHIKSIFDVDIHIIPERKGVPEHEHFDVRYLFEIDEKQPIIQNHETNGIQWIEISKVGQLTAELSVLRMVEKITQ